MSGVKKIKLEEGETPEQMIEKIEEKHEKFKKKCTIDLNNVKVEDTDQQEQNETRNMEQMGQKSKNQLSNEQFLRQALLKQIKRRRAGTNIKQEVVSTEAEEGEAPEQNVFEDMEENDKMLKKKRPKHLKKVKLEDTLDKITDLQKAIKEEPVDEYDKKHIEQLMCYRNQGLPSTSNTANPDLNTLAKPTPPQPEPYQGLLMIAPRRIPPSL